MMEVTTPPCPHCKQRSVVIVSRDEYMKWVAGVHIQDAMPTTPAPIREQLITGMHPVCWNETMGGEEYS